MSGVGDDFATVDILIALGLAFQFSARGERSSGPLEAGAQRARLRSLAAATSFAYPTRSRMRMDRSMALTSLVRVPMEM